MDRRRFGWLLGATVCSLTLPSASAEQQGEGDHGQGNGHGHGNGQGNGNGDNGPGNGHGRGHDNGHGEHGYGHGPDRRGQYFRQQDYGYLRQYYNGPRNLPPGLLKKYYRTGTLPPGWQKRFRPLPPMLVQQLPPVPPYYQQGYLDGYAVVIDPRTRVIVDAVDIVGALTGH